MFPAALSRLISGDLPFVLLLCPFHFRLNMGKILGGAYKMHESAILRCGAVFIVEAQAQGRVRGTSKASYGCVERSLE
jgi:hypothetical protein